MIIDAKLAELCGIQIGDGCLSVNSRYHECAISGDIREEREYYENHVIPLFNEKISVPLINKTIIGKEYPKSGVYGFYIFDKRIVDFFVKIGFKTGKKTNVEIPEAILKNKDIHRFFLRGLFDTDGSIFFQKSNSTKNPVHKFPIIKLSSTSKKLVEQLKIMVEDDGYTPLLQKPYKGKRNKHAVHHISIYRRSEVLRWIEEIGFSSSKHLTKILVRRKLGYCPPHTTIEQRKAILNG